jgi:N-acetylmuramoyl-L-alanine amidase
VDEMLEAAEAVRADGAAAPAVPAALTEPTPADAGKVSPGRPVAPASNDASPRASAVTIREIKRTPLPDGVRVSIEMDGESFYRSERLDGPRRVFFDEGYSVFTLYNPFRLVIDFRRAAHAVRSTPIAAAELPGAAPAASGAADFGAKPASVPAAREPVPLVSRPVPTDVITPTPPAANANGQFSLARQLGLGISRIVLDAGHGGHDPGARANGLSEAELVLDVTLRLRALLEKQPGMEVVLTRDRDVFVPLEERTAMANRAGADLFLSIHANASRNPRARGIETYFLNFASNPEAEAVAARENSASGKSMHSLPEIVRAIALNNKIDESRDFADMVQKAMVRRLSAKNRQAKDLGVKQAPFVVLIGAGMPSVLAEISFVTNRTESALLKTGFYRQQIAESLMDAIVRYQRSLKGTRAVARRE